MTMTGLMPNGIITVEGNYAMLTFKRCLKHPIEAVWAAITDPDQRANWFGITEIDARVGGTIETIAELALDRNKVAQLTSDFAGYAYSPSSRCQPDSRLTSTRSLYQDALIGLMSSGAKKAYCARRKPR